MREINGNESKAGNSLRAETHQQNRTKSTEQDSSMYFLRYLQV